MSELLDLVIFFALSVILAVLGDFFGVYWDLNQQRHLLARLGQVLWAGSCILAVLLFLASPWLAPARYRFLLWLPIPALWLFASFWNRRSLRREETAGPASGGTTVGDGGAGAPSAEAGQRIDSPLGA